MQLLVGMCQEHPFSPAPTSCITPSRVPRESSVAPGRDPTGQGDPGSLVLTSEMLQPQGAPC